MRSILGFLVVCAGSCAAQDTVNFDRDVRPILSDRCFQCHGPNDNDRQADLRLDRAEGPQGAYQSIQPGSPEDSEIWIRVTSDDEDVVMPPPDSSKTPLSDREKEIVKRWIEQGAEYADYWAFVTPQMPKLPDVEDPRWNRQPIDQIVMHRLNGEGLTPKPTADRRTLIRRLSVDLTGLPPTPAEIQHFLADHSADAYERLVDRLLAGPHYGEHMTKYWLDLVRFADTNGIHHDHYREMAPYRNWVIKAFNENLPYDQFVAYQVAGDLYADPTDDQLVASGFNRLHLIIDRGTALPEESFTRNVIDRVTAVGTAFMGLTVQCAVCHDHKYDPITMRDFYQLFAFFNNLDAEPETGGRQGADFRRGLQPPYISLANQSQQDRLADLESKIRSASENVTRLEAGTKQQQESAPEDEQPKQSGNDSNQQAELDRAKAELKQLQQQKADLETEIPYAMVMREREQVRPAHILVRGVYDQPGERVARGTPAFLPPLESKDGSYTRMDFARWLTSDQNPLTARVAVNRFWQQLFGVGIVKTSEDFGAQGDWPSHPDLLDYLSSSLMQSGWNVKALMKEIVMSQTYQQSSEATEQEFAEDPENRLLARGSRFRLDSEVIRDALLASSGLLNDQLYGKSVRPPQPSGLWQSVSMPSSYPRVYEPDAGDRIYRRSLYTFWKRAMPPPQMTILNAPTREACIARRERTNTPLQALLLMNEPEYMKAARHLAMKVIADRSLSDADRLVAIYQSITSHLPDAAETVSLLQMAADLQSLYRDKPELAAEMCEGVALPDGVSPSELAAWTMLTSPIYNLDITKTRG